MTLRDRQLEGLTAHLTRYAQDSPARMVEFYRTRSEGARRVIMERAGVPPDATLWFAALAAVEQEAA